MPLRDDERNGAKERRVMWRASDIPELEKLRTEIDGGSVEKTDIIRLATLLILTGDSKGAINMLSTLDESIEALELNSMAHIECGDYQNAEKYAKSAFKMKAGSPSACVSLAVCKSMEWDVGAAMDFFEIAESCAPDYSRLYVERGLHYLRTGMNLEAVEELKKSVELSPRSAESALELFEAHVALGAYDDAFAALQETLTVIDDCGGLYHAAAMLLKNRGDIEMAKDYINKAISLCPDIKTFEKLSDGLK